MSADYCDKCGGLRNVKSFPITKDKATGEATSNGIFCRSCMKDENIWRRERNQELATSQYFDMMDWPSGKDLV